MQISLAERPSCSLLRPRQVSGTEENIHGAGCTR